MWTHAMSGHNDADISRTCLQLSGGDKSLISHGMFDMSYNPGLAG